MKGRYENTITIENKIKDKLKNDIPILSDFFYWMSGDDKAANTKNVYMNYVKDFLKSIDKDYLNVNKSDVVKYMDSIKYRTNKVGVVVENSPSIRSARLSGISCFYNFLVDYGYIQSNPCINVKAPAIKQDKEIISMTPNELHELRNKIKHSNRDDKWKDRDMAIVSIGCSMGLRVTAISEINIEDVDIDNNAIKVIEKGNIERVVYFGENTKKDIIRWMRRRKKIRATNEDALFVSQKGGRLATRSIYDMITKYTADFDKHITPHKMRSTCATNLYEKTHDIYMVQAVLGHKNIANTRRYANISVKERRNAAEILDAI